MIKLPAKMIWPANRPTKPGFYWLTENGEIPFIVEVDVESDSNRMFFVRLPGEDYKYPLELWPDVSWIGPVDPQSYLTNSPGSA